MTSSIQSWRRAALILLGGLTIGLPFVHVHGESALRFDVPSLRLLLFGTSLLMNEFFIVLAATVFLIFLFMLLTVILGRLWCGWACPQTLLVDLTAMVDRAAAKGFIAKVGAGAASLFVSVLVGANLIWYFVSPQEFFNRMSDGTLGPIITWSWFLLTVIVFLDLLLLRRRFCATVCPYARLQSIMFDDRTLTIAFDTTRAEECKDCRACVKACPVGIDIRRGTNFACVTCAECIDHCRIMMGKRHLPPLVGYFFGGPGWTANLLRRSILILGSITLASLALLLYVSMTRQTLDATVISSAASPRITSDGSILLSYVLAIENRTDTRQEVVIMVTGPSAVKVLPDRSAIGPGEDKKLPIVIVIQQTPLSQKGGELTLVVNSTGKEGSQVIRRVSYAALTAP